MRENLTFIQFWEIRMVLLRHEVSYDIDSLKPAKTTCPLPLAFLWFSHSLRMTKGRRRRMKRQLLFTEMSGIATVTSGHSHSVRYHTQSLNSWERTEVGHPVKPFGIPLCPDLRGPPALPTQNNSKVVNPSARFPCHTCISITPAISCAASGADEESSAICHVRHMRQPVHLLSYHLL